MNGIHITGYEHVEAATLAQHHLEGRRDGGLVGDVADDGVEGRAEVGLERFEDGAAAGKPEDAGAPFEQGTGEGQAEAAAGPGDDGDAVAQVHDDGRFGEGEAPLYLGNAGWGFHFGPPGLPFFFAMA